MKNCNNKIKNTCGDIKPLTCTEFEGDVNSQSNLIGESCISGEEAIQDLYNQIEQLDLSELGSLCLDYVQEDGKNVVKNVLLKFEEKICELETKIEELETTDICNKLITDCNLDFGVLVDDCGEVPTTLAETLQLILNQINTP
jgi:hypothetical protein